MPTYDHRCTKCNHFAEEFYSLVKFDENATMECPECKDATYIRVMEQWHGGFDCVGDGFYANSIHGPKGRWKLDQNLHAEVILGNKDPY